MKTITSIVAATMLLAGAHHAAHAQTANSKLANFCGPLAAVYGPFDYRKGKSDFAEHLYLVESAHYTEDVAAGLKGSTGSLAADLEYTLRVFPNHIRALSTLMRVALRDKLVTLPQGKRPVECFFDRAMRFTPDDSAVHALYGSFLYSRAKDDDRKRALNMFLTSLALDPDNPSVNYNAGLAYFGNGRPQEANRYAQKAYADGFPLPGLKNMLLKAGAWDPAAPLPARALPDKRNAHLDAEANGGVQDAPAAGRAPDSPIAPQPAAAPDSTQKQR